MLLIFHLVMLKISLCSILRTNSRIFTDWTRRNHGLPNFRGPLNPNMHFCSGKSKHLWQRGHKSAENRTCQVWFALARAPSHIESKTLTNRLITLVGKKCSVGDGTTNHRVNHQNPELSLLMEVFVCLFVCFNQTSLLLSVSPYFQILICDGQPLRLL